MSACTICDRVALSARGENPFLIHEFPNSLFVVGDHQYFAGYSLLLLKRHARELHDLSRDLRQALFDELMTATTAVVKAFSPWKINHSCFGNLDPHVHWHIMPRYESDPDHTNHPWLHSGEFAKHKIDPDAARVVATRIRSRLQGNSRR